MSDDCTKTVTINNSPNITVEVVPDVVAIVEVEESTTCKIVEDSIVVTLEENVTATCVVAAGPPGPQGPQGPPGIGVPSTDIRDDVLLDGTVNGVNQVFTLPSSEIAVHNSPGLKIKVYYNGQRLHEGLTNDFVVSESGGAGTGFDTVTLNFAPLPAIGNHPNDRITADYVLDS